MKVIKRRLLVVGRNRITKETLGSALFVLTVGVALGTCGDAWARKVHDSVKPLVADPPTIVTIPGPGCPSTSVTSTSNVIYEVTGNLSTAGPGDCIDLGGSNSGLLINGSITCTGTCGVGVNVSGSQDMVVGNLVTGFTTGLLNSGSQNVEDEFELDENGTGLHLKGSQNDVVSLRACDNSGTGIFIDQGTNNYITNFLAGGEPAQVARAMAVMECS